MLNKFSKNCSESLVQLKHTCTEKFHFVLDAWFSQVRSHIDSIQVQHFPCYLSVVKVKRILI